MLAWRTDNTNPKLSEVMQAESSLSFGLVWNPPLQECVQRVRSPFSLGPVFKHVNSGRIF
jgi:hypothetical protein